MKKTKFTEEQIAFALKQNEVNVSGSGNEPELMPSSNSVGDKATNEISGSELELVAVPAVDCSTCSRIGDLSASVESLSNESISFVAVKDNLDKQIASLTAELKAGQDKFQRLFNESKNKIDEKRKEFLHQDKLIAELSVKLKNLEDAKIDLLADFDKDKTSLIESYEQTIKILKRKCGDTIIIAFAIGIVAVVGIGYGVVYPALKNIVG